MSTFMSIFRRFARKPDEIAEEPERQMRFCQVTCERAIVAWLFANEPNALGCCAFDEVLPKRPLSDNEVDYYISVITVIGKLHMLTVDKLATEAAERLKLVKIIKLEVQKQLGNIRVYLYPEVGPMEFVSIHFSDNHDEVRLKKVFGLLLHILNHCDCSDTDIMINLGTMVPRDVDEHAVKEPLCFSKILPRLNLPQYGTKFQVNHLDWQIDGPLQFYDQLLPKSVHYYGRYVTPDESQELFQEIRRQAENSPDALNEQLQALEVKKILLNVICIALACFVPMLVLLLLRLLIQYGTKT